jgi:ABC-type glycerol-3-phosphate transport system substrate-binding protein
MALPVIPKARLIIIGIGLLLVVIVSALVIFGSRGGGKNLNVTLTVWGVESESAMQALTDTLPENFKITYRSFDPATYESELVNALAAGNGPDAFMIHSSWLPKHADKITPASSAQISAARLQTLFPTVVSQDFAPDGFVYALPLYIDTLALLYNRDAFDAKGIALPPATWQELESIVPKLRERDSQGKLVKAAFAIGGSEKSVTHAADILSALMIQTGVTMVSDDFSRASFSNGGDAALAYYTKFANPGDPLYTWNNNLKSSFDAIADGSAAAVFGYADDMQKIRERSPFIPLVAAPLPQPSGTCKQGAGLTRCDYPSYWGIAVSNKFYDPIGAWNLISNVFTNPSILSTYAIEANRLPALRSLIASKMNDANWNVFAGQALSARSWPQIDHAFVTKTFSDMISDVLLGTPVSSATGKAEDAISSLMAKKKI